MSRWPRHESNRIEMSYGSELTDRNEREREGITVESLFLSLSRLEKGGKSNHKNQGEG